MKHRSFPPFTGVAAAHLGLIDKNCVAKVLLMPSASQGLALRFIGKISTSVCTEVVFSRETLHGRCMSPLEATKFYQVPSGLSYKREGTKVQNNRCKARKHLDMNTCKRVYMYT
ncbi:unknown [Bacteroides sp. CAG:530]|nr:unknown [Bacteroides sp. CAG:530]